MKIERFDPADIVRSMGLSIDLPAVGFVGVEDGKQLGCGGLAWGGGKCWMWFHVEEPQPRHAIAVLHMVKRLKAMARQFGHDEVYTVRDQRWPSSERLLKIIGFEHVGTIDGQEIHTCQVWK